jgi:three-Cys-motif partner protein
VTKLSKGKAHRFGGDWTTTKLEILAKYLSSYTKVLKNQPFTTLYIDAFAGTGYRTMNHADETDGLALLLPELAEPATQQLLDGSARIALKTTPRFSRYIFIDRDPQHCHELESLKREFPSIAKSITVLQGDANAEITKLCDATDWRLTRAVLFIDPYGMQLDWSTIERIAATGSIDLWLLFPLGMGVNRMLQKSGRIPDGWRKRLNLLLGTEEWESALYRVERIPTLFNAEQDHVVKASVEVIGKFFNDRLKKIFAGVAESPAVLRNSKGSPLYLLCFAAANEKGSRIALDIADHILRNAG